MNVEKIYKDAGELVRYRRILLDISQTEMGKRLGMTRTTVTNLEAGRQRIPLHLLYKVAKILHIPIYSLIPENTEADGHSLSLQVVRKKRINELLEEVKKLTGQL